MAEIPADNLFDALVKDIENRSEELMKHILDGGCKDYAQYQHDIGQLRGMREGSFVVRDMQRRYEEI